MGFCATSVLRQGLALRTAPALARRSSCLQLVLARWGLETAALMGLRGEQTANDDERKVRAVDAITSALYTSGLDDHATAAERAMLDKPYRAWEYDDYVYGDHWEAMGVLQWLLGRQDLIPPYYSSFDRAQLFQSTSIMPADPSSIERFVLLGLRDEPSGADAESPVDAALRGRRIPHALRKMAADLPRTIPLAAQSAHERGFVDRIEGGDFGIAVEVAAEDPAAGGATPATVPYQGLETEHLEALRRIAESRFLAFAWALGKIDEWDPERTGDLMSINPINAIWTPDNA
ncbi:hypothetical protein H4R19_001508 [Coemansia spiralis]|nr:hypothetical protein H4R19_001508 [Coemansia spiralis]